jgi:hypothetical protein
MLLTVFSYFEDFVSSIVSEFIELHGGENAMISRAENRDKEFISSIPPDLEDRRKKHRTIRRDARHKEQ